jgi:hypothetical protein
MLSLIFIFTTACGSDDDGKKDTSSKKDNTVTSSEKDDDKKDTSSTESKKDESETTSSGTDVIYNEGTKKAMLNFDKGLDMFGEKSISIIGDSISQGKNTEKMYNDSWVSLFKNAINKKYCIFSLIILPLQPNYYKIP